jgi:hypothetical protein
VLMEYSNQVFEQEILRAEEIILKPQDIASMGEILEKIAPKDTNVQRMPTYRYYASAEIAQQIQKDDFFDRNNQQETVEQILNKNTTLCITITTQDAADERRILGILDEVSEQLKLIANYVGRLPAGETKEEAKNIARKVAVQNIVFVVSEKGAKEQIKKILEKYKNPTTNNEETRNKLQKLFGRVVGIITTEEFSQQTKQKYAMLARKLLGIEETDLRSALMNIDDLIAIMIGDVLVTSHATRDSERGKQIVQIAEKINKPSVVFDKILYKAPSEQNPEIKEWKTRWGFSFYSLQFLRPHAKTKVSQKVEEASNNARTAESLQRDLSIRILLILSDYKQQLSNGNSYEEYIRDQQTNIEQETWKAMAATVYGARKEGNDILTMLMGFGTYDPLRHDVKPISQENLSLHLADPALVIGTLPNTRMPGNRPTLRPVTHR